MEMPGLQNQMASSYSNHLLAHNNRHQTSQFSSSCASSILHHLQESLCDVAQSKAMDCSNFKVPIRRDATSNQRDEEALSRLVMQSDSNSSDYYGPRFTNFSPDLNTSSLLGTKVDSEVYNRQNYGLEDAFFAEVINEASKGRPHQVTGMEGRSTCSRAVRRASGFQTDGLDSSRVLMKSVAALDSEPSMKVCRKKRSLLSLGTPTTPSQRGRPRKLTVLDYANHMGTPGKRHRGETETGNT